MEFLNKHIDMQIQLVQGIAAEIFCERSIYIYIYTYTYTVLSMSALASFRSGFKQIQSIRVPCSFEGILDERLLNG